MTAAPALPSPVAHTPWCSAAWEAQMHALASSRSFGSAWGWTSISRALEAGEHPAPRRSTDVPVREWVHSLDAMSTGLTAAWTLHLIASGLALTDLFSVARTRTLAVEGVNGTAARLPDRLKAVQAQFDQIGVRDALGWLLAVGVDTPEQVDRLRGWSALEVGPQGWAYPAAGLAVDEVAHAVRNGTLDADRALALAALRGAVVPAG